ncbi:carboxypeptidase: vitellogenic-like precursor, partial [Leptotrombidium deliense]
MTRISECKVSQRDYGEPLFLTPFIESGEYSTAKQLSKVKSKQFNCGTESYAGYLTVNKSYNSNLFFWFFPSKTANAPVVLWLDGGPGTSSMYGLFLLSGPFVVNDNLKVKCRKYSWTKAFSVLYIDQPVGSGFSFTENERGFSKDISESTDNLYIALT